MKATMERIEPQRDHERLLHYPPGAAVQFNGKRYIIQRHTTLASGEAAVVLQGETEQFVVGAEEFLAGASLKDKREDGAL
jgi:hypothetical protein